MRTALALILLVAVSAAAQPKKPTSFTSDAHGYRVKFPAPPKAVPPKTLATAGGEVRMDTDRAEVGRDLELAVTVATYPDKFTDVAAKTMLDGVRDGLKGADGKVTDKAISLDGPGGAVVGREVRVEAGGNLIRCRAYLVGTKLYQVMATGTKDKVGGAVADDFLASFEFVADK